jgi:hypothetical protein
MDSRGWKRLAHGGGGRRLHRCDVFFEQHAQACADLLQPPIEARAVDGPLPPRGKLEQAGVVQPKERQIQRRRRGAAALYLLRVRSVATRDQKRKP